MSTRFECCPGFLSSDSQVTPSRRGRVWWTLWHRLFGRARHPATKGERPRLKKTNMNYHDNFWLLSSWCRWYFLKPLRVLIYCIRHCLANPMHTPRIHDNIYLYVSLVIICAQFYGSNLQICRTQLPEYLIVFLSIFRNYCRFSCDKIKKYQYKCETQ